MSEYMTFELGLWNTWIGSVPLLALGFILMLANREVGRRLTDTSWYTASDRRFAFLSFFMMIALVVLSVWVPFRLGTYWFYIGSAIYLVSFAGYLTSFYNYTKTPQGQPVVRGVYRLSRNPLYFFIPRLYWDYALLLHPFPFSLHGCYTMSLLITSSKVKNDFVKKDTEKPIRSI